MRFPFNERKAAQAAAHLLVRAGGKMKYLKLIKLLYLADRESLLETGRPITGATFAAMKHGPILSRVYDLIREEPTEDKTWWFHYISPPKNGYSVEVSGANPDLDELSKHEIHTLDMIFEKYKNVDRFDLADLTHTICPEWSDPGPTSKVISPEEILRAENKSPDLIERIGHEADDLCLINRFAPAQ